MCNSSEYRLGATGGRTLGDILEDLQTRLDSYFGMLTQMSFGLKIRPDEVVEKPLELKKYQQMEATGLPMWAGGLQDQPHIWLEMMGVIRHMIEIRKNLARANKQSEER